MAPHATRSLMRRRELGGGIVSAASLAVGFLLPLTFPNLSRPVLLLNWGIAGCAFIVGIWLLVSRPKVTNVTNIKSLRELYESEFPELFKIGMDFSFGDAERKFDCHAQLHFDFDGHNAFCSIYMPLKADAIVIAAVAAHIRNLYQDLASRVKIHAGYVGEMQQTSSEKLPFSGRVFLYHERHLEPREAADSIEAFERAELQAMLRGPSFMMVKNMSVPKKA